METYETLTHRYTGSPESVIERDLQLLKGKENFLDILNDIMKTELTEDYWNITLPQRLFSSSTRNYAYKVH